MNKSVLKECGVDYDEGVERFMGKAELFERLLKNFLVENTFEAAKTACEADDYDGILKAIHSMKSVTGTLSMNELYKKCCDIVVDIRANKFDTIHEDFDVIYAMYQKVCEGIKNA